MGANFWYNAFSNYFIIVKVAGYQRFVVPDISLKNL